MFLRKVVALIRKEVEYEIDREFFFTLSTIVLGYLKSKSKRFNLYVANRATYILNSAKSNQWFHVESRQNQADCAYSQAGLWIKGPNILWNNVEQSFVISEDDPECQPCIQTYVILVESEESKWKPFYFIFLVFCCMLKFIKKIKRIHCASNASDIVNFLENNYLCHKIVINLLFFLLSIIFLMKMGC